MARAQLRSNYGLLRRWAPDASRGRRADDVSMSTEDRIAPHRVVVVGGGVAAFEAVLALKQLGEGQFALTTIAPEEHFRLRPLDVAAPFARGHQAQLAIEAFMAEQGGSARRTSVVGVDTDARIVRCADGAEVPYDVLLVAVGAIPRPAFTRALTFGSDPLKLNGLLADLEQGWSRSVAFVVPRGCTWPLPLYELALMTAEEVWSMNMDRVELHIVTPEMSPLEVFGTTASAAVRELLDAAKIHLHHGAVAEVGDNGSIELGFGEELKVERIVALPVMEGPRLPGLPCDDAGFIPVDEYNRVAGVDGVYAVGDAADHRIKQGGLACQQADVAAAHIAAAAGAPVDARPNDLVLRGRLLTGGRDRFLRHEVASRRSEAGEEPLWWPPAKVSGRFLAPYLEARGLITLPLREHHRGQALDVRVPLKWAERQAPDVLGLDTLGPLR